MIDTGVKKEVKPKKKVERKSNEVSKIKKSNSTTISIDKDIAKENTEIKSTRSKSKKSTEVDENQKDTKQKDKKTTNPRGKKAISNKEMNIETNNKESNITTNKANDVKIVKEKIAISEMDEYLFHEGKHIQCYEFMGAHFKTEHRKKGVRFTTWAPTASKIVIVGDFTGWELRDEFAMEKVSNAGLWSIFIPGLDEGMKYKFAITNQWGDCTKYKADPYAFKSELRPNTASELVKESKYKWGDKKWINKRSKSNPLEVPMNTYELHLGSWKTKNGEFMTYHELAEALPKYIKDMGYTHVELMPVNEHPLDASWGYQATGYYSASTRFGDLKGLKELVNNLHKEDIGVILDWVPGHFCKDEHGLIDFDGTPTYEYKANWKSSNKGWGTNNFDLGRPEVKSFLISNAMYWINEFHIDGLRVDAVSNILYLDYGREHGEWELNCYGDRGNLEGIQFVKDLNYTIKTYAPGTITIAEESTSWPGITTPVEHGGLGFTFKWNMGWMNDTLRYIKIDPVYRKYHHNLVNFSMMYHYSEKFILPISHDEVVHGKGSLINKMHGDNWNKYAGLRMYAAYMLTHPGKKLLFMGSEFGQFIEWREYEQLQWHVIDNYEIHKKTHNYFKALNHFYKDNKALWELDYDNKGFQWIDADNAEQSILTFVRRGKNDNDTLIVICNFTPVVYYDFKIGVPEAGVYKEIFNTDDIEYGGSNQKMIGDIHTKEEVCHNMPCGINIKIPPMAVLVLKKVN